MASQPLDENLEPDRTIILACGKIREALKTYLEIDKSLSPSISAAAALRLVLRELEGESAPATIRRRGDRIARLARFDLERRSGRRHLRF